MPPSTVQKGNDTMLCQLDLEIWFTLLSCQEKMIGLFYSQKRKGLTLLKMKVQFQYELFISIEPFTFCDRSIGTIGMKSLQLFLA